MLKRSIALVVCGLAVAASGTALAGGPCGGDPHDPSPRGFNNLPVSERVGDLWSFDAWETNSVSAVDLTNVVFYLGVFDTAGNASSTASLFAPSAASGLVARTGPTSSDSLISPGTAVRELYLSWPPASSIAVNGTETVTISAKGTLASTITLHFAVYSDQYCPVTLTSSSITISAHVPVRPTVP